MTDDIVTRLRNHVCGDFEKTSEFMLGLAADEIERLRKLMLEFFNAWTKEIERNNFPSLLVTTIELSEKIEKEIK